jgi:hypothetical protein
VGFVPSEAKAEVKERTRKQWELVAPLDYEGQQDSYAVPVGQTTDFASVPRIFAWFIPPYGRYTKAAILHDYLWRVLAAEGKMEWIDADGLLRRAMRELGVPFLQRWIMWAAVRWAALLKPRGLQGAWRELPRMLLVTLLALPLVLPPAVLIVAALLVYQLLEWIAWVPLKLGAVIKDRRGQPRKELVDPKITFRL